VVECITIHWQYVDLAHYNVAELWWFGALPSSGIMMVWLHYNGPVPGGATKSVMENNNVGE
jgi:hypothetical protein